MADGGAWRTGEKVDIAELGRSGTFLAASNAAFFCAAMVSFKEERLVDGAARGLGAAAGPTLLVNEAALMVPLGFAGSFKSSCFDLVSSDIITLLSLVKEND